MNQRKFYKTEEAAKALATLNFESNPIKTQYNYYHKINMLNLKTDFGLLHSLVISIHLHVAKNAYTDLAQYPAQTPQSPGNPLEPLEHKRTGAADCWKFYVRIIEFLLGRNQRDQDATG